MGFTQNQLTQFAGAFRAAVGEAGGSPVTVDFHDFTVIPVLFGTVAAVEVADIQALDGVKPVNSDGKLSKDRRVGVFRLVIDHPDGGQVSFLLDSGSIKQQISALCDEVGTPYDFDPQAWTPEALREREGPPLLGVSIGVAFTGMWQEGDKSGRRFSVAHMPSVSAARDAWEVFKRRVRQGTAGERQALPQPADEGHAQQ